MRFLVRVNFASAEWFQSHATHKTRPRKLLPFPFKRLCVAVDRGLRLALQDAFATPILEETGGTLVLLVARITRFLAVENQPDRVGGMLLIQLGLHGFVDHIVRRGDHVTQGSDVAKVVSDPVESLNGWHRVLSVFVRPGSVRMVT